MKNLTEQNPFHATSYSENASLGVFLKTLSYHKAGAAYFSKELGNAGQKKLGSMLDVGCGDGQFTSELMALLADIGISVGPLLGVDPDADNLAQYQSKLRTLGIETSTRIGGLESLPQGAWDTVLCSHSLYQSLENPAHTHREKLRLIAQLVAHTAPKGRLMISMASHLSPAYLFKKELHAHIGKFDASSFGEHVFDILKALGLAPKAIWLDSYIDVSGLMDGPESLIVDWVRYFCRLSREESLAIGVQPLRRLMSEHIRIFATLPESMQQQFIEAPAACGRPIPETRVLLHKELFLTLVR